MNTKGGGVMQRISDVIGKIMGRDDERKTEDATRRVKTAEETLRRAPKNRVREFVKTGIVLACALALPGCSALAQALGVDPKATAPAYSGVGVVVLGSPDTRVTVPAKTDQSGAVGATGSAKTDADQTTTAEIPAEAVAAMVEAARSLLAAGQPDAAAALLARVAKKPATEKPAAAPPAAPPAAPAPAPAAPTTPEPSAPADATKAPVETK